MPSQINIDTTRNNKETRHYRETKSKDLREAILTNPDEVAWQRQWVVDFPTRGSHENHQVGVVSLFIKTFEFFCNVLMLVILFKDLSKFKDCQPLIYAVNFFDSNIRLPV